MKSITENTPGNANDHRGRASKLVRKQPRRKCAGGVEPFRDKKSILAIKGVTACAQRDYTLNVIGINTGFRGGDLLRTRWRNVLTDDGKIGDRLELTEGKTGKRRSMPLPEEARKALEKLRREKGTVAPDDYVFPSREGGGPLSTQRLNQLVKSWAKAAGVPGRFGAHTLRKTFGYHLRKSGYDLGLIMEVLGHSSVSVTKRYLGITQDEIDAAALKLNL